MVLLLLLIAVLLVGLALAVLAGRLPAPGVLPPVTTESAAPPPVSRVLSPHDLTRVRFDLALRGYRMSQVDALLERLQRELAERDAEIARLRGEAS